MYVMVETEGVVIWAEKSANCRIKHALAALKFWGIGGGISRVTDYFGRSGAGNVALDQIGKSIGELGITDVEISYLQGFAFVLSYTLVGLPLGYLVDRYSRRMIVLLGVLWWSACSGAGAFVHDYEHLLIARLGVGAGEAALLPAAYSLLGDAFDRKRLGRATAIFSTGAIFGGARPWGWAGRLPRSRQSRPIPCCR